MISENVLYFISLFIIMITHLTMSHYEVPVSTNVYDQEQITPQGPHNLQNTVTPVRVSNRKCKEYIGEEYVTEVKRLVKRSTENVKDPPEESSVKPSENDEETNKERKIMTVFDGPESPNHLVLQVVGGEAAIIDEFPHMAAIGWKNSNGSHNYDCGGALISPKFVLTAAHCTYSHIAEIPIPDVVRLGDNFLEGFFHSLSNPMEVGIKEIHKHPQYTRKKQYNDIALLELEIEVHFDYNIQPACLWTSSDLSNYNTAIATGWGAVDSYSGKKADTLQKVSLQLISNEICNISLGNLINKKWDKGFLESQLCAGEPAGGKDTCQGDSGSPLQIPTHTHQNRYYAIGITSFGPKICAHLPAVYTRVSSYLDWIESKVWPDEYKDWLNSTSTNQ